MSKKEKVALMIRMGIVAYLVCGVCGYLFDKALFSNFLQLNSLIVTSLVAVALHNFKSGGDNTPTPPSQPAATEDKQ